MTVTRLHFALLQWPKEAETGPEIPRTCGGPTRPCVTQFVLYGLHLADMVGCLGGMLCFIVCFLGFPGPDEIFKWSYAWPRGFVGSQSHCLRGSMPIFQECGGLARLVPGVIRGTEQLCYARAGRTPDGACDPQKRSNIPGGASHIMKVRNKSYFDQPTA